MLLGRTPLLLGTMMISLGVLLGEWGCSKRQLSSGAEDQSMTTKNEKGETETVLQEPITSLATPPASAAESAPDSRPSLGLPPAPGSSALTSPSESPIPAPASTIVPASSASDLTGLGDIFFDFDQYLVRRDAHPVLESNARLIRNEPGKSLLIEGHCDERGTLAYNLVLGEKRAKAAKRYLEDFGIPASRIQTISYGEIRPFCKEHNEGCWKYNRRAHFVLQ